MLFSLNVFTKKGSLMFKQCGLIFVLLFLSHDVLLCMEHIQRTSQENERQPLIVYQLAQCGMCKKNIDSASKFFKIESCNHTYHSDCLVKNALREEYFHVCESCYLTENEVKKITKNALVQVCIDTMDTKELLNPSQIAELVNKKLQDNKRHRLGGVVLAWGMSLGLIAGALLSTLGIILLINFRKNFDSSPLVFLLIAVIVGGMGLGMATGACGGYGIAKAYDTCKKN
jgi:hypothetical protein